jgi:hypothetical protein
VTARGLELITRPQLLPDRQRRAKLGFPSTGLPIPKRIWPSSKAVSARSRRTSFEAPGAAASTSCEE